MARRIHHMGMTMGKDEHDAFHKKNAELSPRQHDALMKRLGVTKEEDEEWHRTHPTLAEQRNKGMKPVDPFALGAAFVAWCVRRGWLVQRGQDYFAGPEGSTEIRERFDIKL
jgi:hypothetical protein